MADLSQLAKDLRLTQKQRRFAEALALDPERNQTKAAMAAGSTVKRAHVTGSQWVRLGKVQAYIKAFLGVSPEGAVVAKRVRPRIADRNEVLRRLTRQARADVGLHLAISGDGTPAVAIDPRHTGIIRGVKVKNGPTDKVTGQPQWTETEIKVADPVPPLVALARIYGMEDQLQKPGDRTLIINVLHELPRERLRELTAGLLAGGNGNGNGDRRTA